METGHANLASFCSCFCTLPQLLIGMTIPAPSNFTPTFHFQMKPELLEMEKDMAAVSASMKSERLESIYIPSSSTINTQCATVATTNTWLTTEPVQWSRLRMTYSFEYAIMKQFGKVLL